MEGLHTRTLLRAMLFNLQCNSLARQVERRCCPYYTVLVVLNLPVLLIVICPVSTRDEIAELGLDEVLIHIRNESTDRDAWRMADHGLMILHNVKPVGKQTSGSGGKSNTSQSSGNTLTTDLPNKKAL